MIVKYKYLRKVRTMDYEPEFEEGFFCESRKDYFTENECDECNIRSYCKQFKKMTGNKEVIEEINNKELLAHTRKCLQEQLGMSDTQADELIEGFSDTINSLYLNRISVILKALVEVSAQNSITQEIRLQINGELKKALTVKTIECNKDSIEATTIEKMILERIKAMFVSNDSRGRKIISDTVESAIKSNVNEKVGEAIEEIKAETIEKYNKMIMKKMMHGMAQAIGADKKLLSMMIND